MGHTPATNQNAENRLGTVPCCRFAQAPRENGSMDSLVYCVQSDSPDSSPTRSAPEKNPLHWWCLAWCSMSDARDGDRAQRHPRVQFCCRRTRVCRTSAEVVACTEMDGQSVTFASGAPDSARLKSAAGDSRRHPSSPSVASSTLRRLRRRSSSVAAPPLRSTCRPAIAVGWVRVIVTSASPRRWLGFPVVASHWGGS